MELGGGVGASGGLASEPGCCSPSRGGVGAPGAVVVELEGGVGTSPGLASEPSAGGFCSPSGAALLEAYTNKIKLFQGKWIGNIYNDLS